MSEAGASLAALVRAAARRGPDAPAVVAGDAAADAGRSSTRAVDRAAAGYAALRPGAAATGSPSSCPTA